MICYIFFYCCKYNKNPIFMYITRYVFIFSRYISLSHVILLIYYDVVCYITCDAIDQPKCKKNRDMMP